jgi:hypothetical protein
MRIGTLALLTIFACAALAQAPAAKPRGGGGGRTPPVPDDNAGFESIFDGMTLNGWDGDKSFWRVENSAITGETTAEKPLKLNTFIIWNGGTTRDFELKLEYRITESGNSGVQYRSIGVPEAGPHVLKGYQADIDGMNRYTGMLYEERGRGFLAERGQAIRMAPGRVRKMLGSPGDADQLKSVIKVGDWNRIHIIARGTVITHIINDRIVSLFVDDDPEGRSAEGKLGLQLHQGPPMKVEFRNILLRKL